MFGSHKKRIVEVSGLYPKHYPVLSALVTGPRETGPVRTRPPAERVIPGERLDLEGARSPHEEVLLERLLEPFARDESMRRKSVVQAFVAFACVVLPGSSLRRATARRIVWWTLRVTIRTPLLA